MAFPNVDWFKVRDAFDQMIEANGSDADVKLRDSTQFQMRMVERNRMPNSELTSGISQREFSALCMYHRWVAAAPADREPEKGDQITMNGRRKAVDSVGRVGPDATPIGYIMRFRG